MKTQASFMDSLNLILAIYQCLKESLTEWKDYFFNILKMRLTLIAQNTNALSWWTAPKPTCLLTQQLCVENGIERGVPLSFPCKMATHTWFSTKVCSVQDLKYLQRNQFAILWSKPIMASIRKITIRMELSLAGLFLRISTYFSTTTIFYSLLEMGNCMINLGSELITNKRYSLREGLTSFS